MALALIRYRRLIYMMILHSGTTCPFSQRCRFVFMKGHGF